MKAKMKRGTKPGTPSHKCQPVGTRATRTHNGITYIWEKFSTGWLRVERLTPYKDGEERAKSTKAGIVAAKKEKKVVKPPKNGDMLAGKNLINLHRAIDIKQKFNPDTHERVYIPEKKGWVERIKK